jgi:hypothetical protein
MNHMQRPQKVSETKKKMATHWSSFKDQALDLYEQAELLKHVNHSKRKECIPQFPKNWQSKFQVELSYPLDNIGTELLPCTTQEFPYVSNLLWRLPHKKTGQVKYKYIVDLDDTVLNPTCISEATTVKKLTINPPRSVLSTTPNHPLLWPTLASSFLNPEAVSFTTIFCD